VLILAPTREIAAQVADVITTIGQGHEGNFVFID
jgi:superfamily II DNA/RNA helicase